MSSTIAVIAILALLVALAGYAFITQSLEQRRRQRERLLAALQQRARNLRVMLESFPKGFLSKELNLLLHRSLVETLQQLSELGDDASEQAEALTQSRQHLEAAKRQPRSAQPPSLDNPHQIREVKALLQDLHAFLDKQRQAGKLPQAQFSDCEGDIRQLVTCINADSYQLSARQAEENGKPRLAVHYYGLACQLLERKNAEGTLQPKLERMRQRLQRLEKVAGSDAAGGDTEEPEENTSGQWDEFERRLKGEDWQKKQIYD